MSADLHRDQSPRVGILGLGRMGKAIAGRLAGRGHCVSGWTRRGLREVEASELGITAVPNIASLCRTSDIIVLSLFDDAAVTAVVAELSENNLKGKLIVDTSTVSPDTLRSFAGDLAEAGGAALDAPISGGPEVVLRGTAGIYIGGDKTHVDIFMPVARSFCDRIYHVGGPGAGAATKIVNNMMLCGYWQCLIEALQVGKKSGLTLETMLEILCSSPAANGALIARKPIILNQSKDVGVTVSAVIKDASLFARTAARLDVAVPALTAALANFMEHGSKGNSEADVGSVISAAYFGA